MATESTPTFRRLKQLMSTASASAETEMTARFMGGAVILQRSIRGRMRADDSPRASLPADPGPDEHTRSHPARDGGADDRSPRPGVRRARPRGARRTEDGVSDRVAGRHLSGVRQRRLGSVARQHAVARRRRARVRHRRVLEELGRGGAPARPRRRAHARHLAARRRSRRGRRAARARSRSSASRRCSSSTTRRRPG